MEHDYTPDKRHSAAYGWAKAQVMRLKKFFTVNAEEIAQNEAENKAKDNAAKGKARPTGGGDIKAGPG